MNASMPDDPAPTIDHDAAVEHVRNAWLNMRIVAHVDAIAGGGYAFDPSDYAPVPVERDGEKTVVFART